MALFLSTLMALVSTPFVVYLSVKLGTIAFFIGRQKFNREFYQTPKDEG